MGRILASAYRGVKKTQGSAEHGPAMVDNDISMRSGLLLHCVGLFYSPYVLVTLKTKIWMPVEVECFRPDKIRKPNPEILTSNASVPSRISTELWQVEVTALLRSSRNDTLIFCWVLLTD